MNDHVYKQIELTGSSKTSIEDAVQSAITKASQTLHDLRWFHVAGGDRGHGKPDLFFRVCCVDNLCGQPRAAEYEG